ncbi:MAG: YqgE/AlgH family protein [Marinirhabdus sp.]
MTTPKPAKGVLLVAEPSIMGDVSFNRSVVLLAEHNHTGSVGFILNKPLDHSLRDFVPELNSELTVYNGGPVEQDNLYFIHRVPELIPGSIEISNGVYWGGNFNSVTRLLQQKEIDGRHIRFFLGYSGWDVLQLENELQVKSWVVIPNDHERDVISRADGNFWKEKMIEFGGDYLIWSNAPENPAYN